MPKYGAKMPYLSIFGLEFSKNIVIFEISPIKFVKHGFLTHTVNFGMRSAFSKGLRFAFSEGPGAGPGPLYKVRLPTLSIKKVPLCYFHFIYYFFLEDLQPKTV